jgi:hypothetical protein
MGMTAFTRRSWYFAALAVAGGAIASQLVSKHYAGLGMTSVARSGQALADSELHQGSGHRALAKTEADESKRLKEVAFRSAHRADQWGGVSLVLALLAAIYWVLARFRRKSSGHRWLLALLAVYLLLFLLMI